jgi:hypothetical protein
MLNFINCKTYKDSKTEKDFVVGENYKFDKQIDSILEKGGDDKSKHQYAATLYSIKGEHPQALKQWDSAFQSSPQTYSPVEIDSIKKSFKVIDAVDYIVQKSKKEKIVILNEAHYNAAHRVFSESLLEGLFKNGYRILCLEAMTNGDGKFADLNLNKRGYPIRNTGLYTENPSYGNFIRKALEIGFEIFPYETTGEIGGKSREIEQTKNINDIISSHPEDKIFIYCGFGHNQEGKVEQWGMALAERIKKLTNIDPLTIDQTRYSEKGSLTLSDPLLKIYNLKRPSVLINKYNHPLGIINDSSWVDIAVFQPFTKYIDGRPSWLVYDNKKKVHINLSTVKINFPILLMAFNSNENVNNSVPTDIIEVKNKNDDAVLILAQGDYNIIGVNEINKVSVLKYTVE